MINPAVIALTWLLAMPVIAVLGAPVSRAIGAAGPTAVRIALWSGLAVLTLVANVVNLWLPLRSLAACLVVVAVVIACGAAALASRTFRRGLRTGWSRPGWLGLTALGVVVAVLAVGSSLAPTHFDFGLYHFELVKLASDYPALRGQTNLLSYLGYSNTHFPVAALLTNGPAGVDGYRALNGLLGVTLAADLALRMSSRRRGIGFTVSALNVIVILVPLLVLADWLVASPTSDTAVLILTAAATAGLAEAAYGRGVTAPALVMTLVPLVLATSMRPQVAIILLASAAVLVVLARRDGTRPRARAAVGVTVVIGALLGAVGLARDYLFSGWAFYPLSVFHVDVPWLADDPTVLREITIAIARDPSPTYQQAVHGYAWLPAWVSLQARQWEFWATALLVLAGLVCLVVARRRSTLRLRRLVLVLLPSIAFLVAWLLVLPPTWRHAMGPGLSIGILVIAWSLTRARLLSPALLRAGLVALVVIALGCAVIRYPSKPRQIPDAPTRVVTLPSGLEVLTPTLNELCWDAPVPCTPYPDERLRLLGPGLADGLSVRPR